MSEVITIIVAGEPVAAGRPRVTKQGLAYTPTKTRSERAVIRLLAQEAMKGRPPLEGPLYLSYAAYRRIPSSFSKKRRALAIAGAALPITRPDFDNYLKMVDALAGIVWVDDAQVTDALFCKRYSEKPRIEIRVTRA